MEKDNKNYDPKHVVPHQKKDLIYDVSDDETVLDNQSEAATETVDIVDESNMAVEEEPINVEKEKDEVAEEDKKETKKKLTKEEKKALKLAKKNEPPLTKAEKKKYRWQGKNGKPTRFAYVWVVIMSVLNIGALACFFIAYGPFNYLRDLYVTTAMKTMTHKYLANVLYSNETIQTILANNVIIEPDEVMDENAIKIGNIEEPATFSSIYEEQVLKRDPGNDVYKMVRLNESGFKGWIVFIYDPTMVDLAVTKKLGVKGEFVTQFAKERNAYVAINAGGFKDYGGDGTAGQPSGYVISNGKVVYKRNREATWAGGTIGFTQEGVMILTKKVGSAAVKKGVYDGVDFGPFLIVNGKKAEVSGNGGWGIHPRTLIGQRQDGIVIFMVIDGRSTSSIGIDLNTAITIMKRYNAYNAANLDGGASSTLVADNKLINHPTWYTADGQRENSTAWVVVDKK